MRVALLAVLVSVIPAPPSDGGEPFRIVALGGSSFGGRAWESSEFGSAAVARDLRVFGNSRFVGSGEIHPLLGLRQRRLDRNGTEGRVASALGLLLAYRGGARGPGWGYRVELGSGLLYSWNGAIPADASRFNFFDQAGASVVFSRADRTTWSLGYRFVHSSNLNLFSRARNAGVSFHALVVSCSCGKWGK